MEKYVVSLDNIRKDLETLAKISRTPGEGVTRPALTKEDFQARAYIKGRMKENGLSVQEDAIGNIYGTLEGKSPELSPVWSGSHIDTVINGGAFDGTAGVVAALEALRTIRESGEVPQRSLTAVVFTSEEPTQYGMGCIGSQGLAGKIKKSDAEQIRDYEGISLEETLRKYGYPTDDLNEMGKEKGSVFGFVELHIEQGEVLDQLGCPLGIVHFIAAPTDIHVSVYGKQSHAGATPMDLREDALAAAAEMILEIEKLAKSYQNVSTVATVGKLDICSNSSNVIPGEVHFTIDIRSNDFEEKQQILLALQHVYQEIEMRRHVRIEAAVLCNEKPALADEKMLQLMKTAAQEYGLQYHDMGSGAYHDAMMISEFAPFGMIFVPSKAGISHDRREWTDYEQIADGTKVLASVIKELADQK